MEMWYTKYKSMEVLKHAEYFDALIEQNPMVLTYFSGESCSVCRALKPKIDLYIGSRYPEVRLIEIPVADFPELSARFSVFTVPVVLFWVEGREYIREARTISVDGFLSKMEKIISRY